MKELNEILETVLEKLKNGEQLSEEEEREFQMNILELAEKAIAKREGTSVLDIQTKMIVSETYCKNDMDEFLKYYGTLEENLKISNQINGKYGELVCYILPRLTLISTLIQTKKIGKIPVDVRKVGILLEELGQKMKKYEGEI